MMMSRHDETKGYDMTVAELIARLQEFPPDYDVAIGEWDSVYELVSVENWLHFQTDQPLGAVVLEAGDPL